MKEKVTVTVLSYNAEKTIIESLDSVLKQTYGSKWIDLTISDDASNDKTVTIIEQWVKNHQDKFSSIRFYKQKQNIGIVKSANLVYRSSKTKWIKPLAGDDLLLPDCITENMKYISENPEIRILFSRARIFYGNTMNIIGKFPDRNVDYCYEACAQKQFEHLYFRGNFVVAPTIFISKDALEVVGYVDEHYRTLDDYVLWFDLTRAGIQLRMLDSETVLYRTHEKGVSFVGKKNLSNYKIFLEKQRIIQTKVYPTLLYHNRFIDYLGYILTKWVIFSFNNKKNVVSDFFIRLFQFRRPYL